MQIIRVRFSDRQSRRMVEVDVDRCVRHRGTPSLNNYFIIGRNKHATIRYRLYLRPISLAPLWQSANQLDFDHMVKWADGTLTPQYMTFYYCSALDAETMIPRVLALAFNSKYSDEHLEDFHEAEIRLPFLSHKVPQYTIASVIGINSKL